MSKYKINNIVGAKRVITKEDKIISLESKLVQLEGYKNECIQFRAKYNDKSIEPYIEKANNAIIKIKAEIEFLKAN